nr:type III-B CRISPR module-associated protein Cmr5 [uncultured Methanoregula sp.]
MSEEKILTKNQIRAEIAYDCVNKKVHKDADISQKEEERKYLQLARSFPALVHTCGLVQAVAFVTAKEKDTGKDYLRHLETIMPLVPETLVKKSRTAPLLEYQRLTRDAMDSATWLKRYAETLLKES